MRNRKLSALIADRSGATMIEYGLIAAFVAVAAVAALNWIAGDNAVAELLSSRPITVVIPFTPGASSDTLQRLVARKVSENTGQTIVVESRPGGSGAIASVFSNISVPADAR